MATRDFKGEAEDGIESESDHGFSVGWSISQDLDIETEELTVTLRTNRDGNTSPSVVHIFTVSASEYADEGYTNQTILEKCCVDIVEEVRSRYEQKRES